MEKQLRIETFQVIRLIWIIESLRNTTRLLMTGQRSLETSAIFRFAPMLARGWRDRALFHKIVAAGGMSSINIYWIFPYDRSLVQCKKHKLNASISVSISYAKTGSCNALLNWFETSHCVFSILWDVPYHRNHVSIRSVDSRTGLGGGGGAKI